MIDLIFKVKNPFPKDNFKNIWFKAGSITEFKNWEMQFSYCRDLIFGISLDTSFSGRDHAGPELELILLGFSLNFKIYDSRHWDYKKSIWQVYE